VEAALAIARRGAERVVRVSDDEIESAMRALFADTHNTAEGGGSAALAALLSLDRLFQADFEDGSLDVLALSPLSMESAATAKILAHWLTTGLPLVVLSPVLGLLLNLPAPGYGALVASLLIGTPALSGVGAIGAALTLSIRRGGLILALIVLPLITPALIFGSGAVMDALDGTGRGAFLFLAAFSVAAVGLSPFAAAAAVRLNLGS